MPNIVRLRVRNYLVIDDSTMYFESGKVYLVTGGNQAGKTSMADALYMLLENKQMRPLSGFLREGETTLYIEAELDTGHILERTEGLKKSRKITYPDGTTLSTPLLSEDEWTNVLQTVSEEGENMNIRHGASLLLFRDTSPSATYKLYSRVTGTAHLLDCQGRTKEYLKKAKDDAYDYGMKLSSLEQGMPVLPEIPVRLLSAIDSTVKMIDMHSALSAFITTQQKLTQIDTEMSAASNFNQADIAALAELLEQYKVVKAVVAAQQELAELEETMQFPEVDSRFIRELHLQANKISSLDTLLRTEKQLDSLEVIERNKDKEAELFDWVDRLNKCKKAYEELTVLFTKKKQADDIVATLEKTVKVCGACGSELAG